MGGLTTAHDRGLCGINAGWCDQCLTEWPCAQCGTVTEVHPMDFGPYVGKLICDDCWDSTQPANTATTTT